MSGINPGSIGNVPLTSSVAGLAGQQRSAAAGEKAAEQAAVKFQLDRNAAREKAVGDVASADETDDRDADGRLPWGFTEEGAPPPKATENRGQPPRKTAGHPPDLDGERGRVLDIDA